ncbi:MAG TPA: type II toxin-antitoxin system HicB family antitoxin [Vicinamibacterales bacterium]|nr:type II toxin-antitoxin system HicB family antitoxin [Vicinamibacterales bacterium]
MKSYRVAYERDESGWWVATVRGVRGCHMQGRTVDEARRAAGRALEATAAARRLTHRPSAILSAADVGVSTGELHRILAASFPGLPASARARCEDTIRWHPLGARCREARGPRSVRDVSVALGIPQYRLNAIERGRLSEIHGDLARRYLRFLGMDTWVARWCRANRELAARAGLADVEGRAPRRSDAGPKRRSETREIGQR